MKSLKPRMVLSVLAAIAVLASFAGWSQAFVFTSVSDPLAAAGTGTEFYGVSGDLAVGSYSTGSGVTQGTYTFVYNLSTQTYANNAIQDTDPNEYTAYGYGTFAGGINGNTIVGDFSQKRGGYYHTLWTANIATPASPVYATSMSPYSSSNTYGDETFPAGISSTGTIVGYFDNYTSPLVGPAGYNGYYYNVNNACTQANWNLMPATAYTGAKTYWKSGGGYLNGAIPMGISSDGTQIVGNVTDQATVVGQTHGFVLNLNTSTYTYYDDPLAGTAGESPTNQAAGQFSGTFATGISGSNIVGVYYDAAGDTHGFWYNGSSYVTIDDPLAALGSINLGTGGTEITGIDGTTVVGYYENAAGLQTAFVTELPEPGTLTLLALGGLALIRRRRGQK